MCRNRFDEIEQGVFKFHYFFPDEDGIALWHAFGQWELAFAPGEGWRTIRLHVL